TPFWKQSLASFVSVYSVLEPNVSTYSLQLLKWTGVNNGPFSAVPINETTPEGYVGGGIISFTTLISTPGITLDS
ncbi:hypothetical protein KEJ17_04050, partial [Candidatus Bathyarchaeota archaeon]|nr:hypothetical protein [Candidatus Bathyarchaeota archaeon]